MTTSHKAVITDWGFESLDTERRVFAEAGIELDARQCRTEEEVAEAVRDADVVLTQWAPVRQLAISAMDRCKGIVRYGIGLDNVDLVSAADHNIPVRNIPDYCLNEVADHTLALMLSLQRQVCHVHDLTRKGTWKIVPPLPFPALRHSTLGLVGFGRIARLVAVRAKAFGLRVIAADAYVDQVIFQNYEVEHVDTDTLFSTSDIVSLHCPLTNDTHNLVDEEILLKMKPLAMIINTSRGGLINTDALVKSLYEQRIAGVALDVLEKEPPPADSELLKFPNAIVTSHISWYSSASVGELQRLAAEAAVQLIGRAQAT